MVYDVVGLVDKKYIVDQFDSENSFDFVYDDAEVDNDGYDDSYDVEELSEVYNSAYVTPKKAKSKTKSSKNIIEVVKERLVLLLAREIVKTELIVALGDDEDAIIESLSNYSLEDLFYMRKGLKEYELMDSIQEQDFLGLFKTDTKGQLNFL